MSARNTRYIWSKPFRVMQNMTGNNVWWHSCDSTFIWWDVSHKFWELGAKPGKTANITAYSILKPCYAKTTGPGTNVLHNVDWNWNWPQIEDCFMLNVSVTVTMAHAASAISWPLRIFNSLLSGIRSYSCRILEKNPDTCKDRIQILYFAG